MLPPKGSLGPVWDHLKVLYIEHLMALALFSSFLVLLTSTSAVQDWAGADANPGGQQPGSIQCFAHSGGLASCSHLPPLCLHTLPAGFHTHCT